MPYAHISDLPAQTDGLPNRAKHIFRAAFNNAMSKYEDETRAFQTAWGAVKKKYKKVKKRWVLKQETGDDVMRNIVSEIKAVHNLFGVLYPDTGKDRVEEAGKILQACNETTDWPRTLDQLAETFTPAFVPLEQFHDEFPGSFQSVMNAISAAYQKQYRGMNGYSYITAYYPDKILVCRYSYSDYSTDSRGYYVLSYTYDADSHEVTFGEPVEVDLLTIIVPDGATAEARKAVEDAVGVPAAESGGETGDDAGEYDEGAQNQSGIVRFVSGWSGSVLSAASVQATVDPNDKAKKKAMVTNPDVLAPVIPETGKPALDLDDDDEDLIDPADASHDQTMMTKTENGKKFGQGAYLIVGDATKTSTWKVRVEETPGTITAAQLGRAYAVLTKGFRENKVQASDEQVQAALKKLKILYRKAEAPYPGSKKNQDYFGGEDNIPEWLILGADPPGGDEELIQSFTYPATVLKQDKSSGKMTIEGIATVANVINSKNQVYPAEVWQDNLPRLNRLAQEGILLGECDHPVNGRSTLEKTAFKYTKLWMDDNQVKFEADVLPTKPHGENIQILVASGVPVNISSRGSGTVKQGEWNGIEGVNVVQRGFLCQTFDGVAIGASPGSQVTDYRIAQSSNAAEEEELEMGELSDSILQQLKEMAAQSVEDRKLLATVADKVGVGVGASTGAGGAPPASAAGSDPPASQNQDGVSTIDGGGQQLGWSPDVLNQMNALLVDQRIGQLYEEAKLKLPVQWANTYRKHLINQGVKSVADLEKLAPSIFTMIESLIQDSPKFPGVGFVVQPSAGEKGPKTPRELIEELISDLPDESDSDPVRTLGMQGMEQQGIRDHIRTPRRQARRWLTNIATARTPGWNGPAAITGLLRLAQGYSSEIVQDFLDQACDEGTTSVASGGAPISTAYIFPLVRRMFPMLIVNEIASIQPMDRPEGKIFYLDHYRVEPTLSETDAAGVVSSSRVRIDRTSSLSSSYSDDPGECNVSKRIQLHLAAKPVSAQTKKLHSIWSIEELQDLRAYHGLDVATELTTGMARELSMEWNQIVLNEMLAGAAAGNVSFGTAAPAGFTQTEWDRYIARFIFQAGNNIFKHRRGEMTHIVAGADAWLRLVGIFNLELRNINASEAFTGLSMTPFTDGPLAGLKTYKTSFWDAVNTNKILVIRRGPEWSDVPYVFAPYIDYISPVLTLPDVFTQKQGMMSRAAHTTVVPEAMSVITINVGATGVVI